MATLNEGRLKKRKRQRIGIISFFSILELLISPLLANLLNQFFLIHVTKEEQRYIFNYLVALRTLQHDERVLMLFIFFQMLWIAFVVYYSLGVKPVIGKVDEMAVTENISIPVPAGNGQHGNERFLNDKEKDEIFNVFLFSGSETVKGKGGIVVQMTHVGRTEKILYVGKDLHSLIIGASGSGKTRRILLESIWLQLLSGLCVITSDVKGEIYNYTYPFAESLGYEAIAIDLRNPKKSVHYNFLQPILDAFEDGDTAKGIDLTWDLVSVLVGQQKGEPLWYNGETATIAAAILIIVIDAPVEYKNLTNVYYFLAFMCESDAMGDMPINGYLEKLPDTHPAKGVFAMAKIAAEKTRSSFFTSALGTLRLFTNPNISEMTSKSDFSFKDIGMKKMIIYMIIPDEKKTMYPLVSILITQMYTQLVETANENGLRLPIDTDFDLDEVGNFPMIPVLGNILSAGRSRGVRANLVIQDYQQLESKYKDDFKNIKTNCQIKLYLKSDDPDTLKNVSENLGKYTVEVSSASTSAQDGKKSQLSYSSSASLTGRALLEPAEVKRIESPWSICMVTGKYPGINHMPDLTAYRVNNIYGMGDEAHNTKLLMERDQKRKEHLVGEMQLWGVWNDYKDIEEAGENSDRISFL